MGERNMMIDIEMEEQSRGYVQAEPCIFLSNARNFPRPNRPDVVISPNGNFPNIETHHLPDQSMFYGMTRYHNVHHTHHRASSLDMGVSNFHLPYPPYHGPPSQFPSSSSHSAIGIASDEYERNAQLMDPTRGSYKQKNTEGNPANFQHLNAADASPFSLPPPYIGSQLDRRSGRNRPGPPTMEPLPSHGQDGFIHANYLGQPVPSMGSIWFDQHHQMSTGRSDAPLPPSWSQLPPVPYMPGHGVVSGSIETGSIRLPRYHETYSSGNPTAFVYPSPLNPRHPYVSHHPSASIQESHNATVYPRMASSASASYRAPGNYGSSHVGPVQPSGFRIYHRHRDEPVPEPTLRHRGLPCLRIMPADEDVVILDAVDMYDDGNHIDHHRDMRMDIEDMSYEELLALSERIGTVNTGLSEEKINKKMETRMYLLSGINLEETPTTDMEADSCTICQENYKNKEKIGALGCGHEYHADCLQKWLLVKNVCPICKSEALSM